MSGSGPSSLRAVEAILAMLRSVFHSFLSDSEWKLEVETVLVLGLTHPPVLEVLFTLTNMDELGLSIHVL